MKLLESIKISEKTLKNRMAMAPMTRSRANLDGEVAESTILYYTQYKNIYNVKSDFF